MNREHMIAWLALEGYSPYAYPNPTAAGFTLSRDGERGIWCDEQPVAVVSVHDQEIVHGWESVPSAQLRRGYNFLVKEKDHAS